MTQTVTVTLSEHLYRQLQQKAELVNRSMSEVAVTALEALVVAVEGDLPPALQAELSAMEHLSDEALWQIGRSVMNEDKVALYDVLLERNQAGTLTPEGREWLDVLRNEAEALMLRKAHAYALLKSRGHKLPSLDELRT